MSAETLKLKSSSDDFEIECDGTDFELSIWTVESYASIILECGQANLLMLYLQDHLGQPK